MKWEKENSKHLEIPFEGCRKLYYWKAQNLWGWMWCIRNQFRLIIHGFHTVNANTNSEKDVDSDRNRRIHAKHSKAERRW